MKKKIIIIVSISLIIILTLFSLVFIFDNFCIIEGDSMFPTLKNNQICKIYKNQKITLNSIVIFKFQNTLMVKRVIGMEEDNIIINNKGIYRNTELIIAYEQETDEIKTQVGKDQIFVVGDNLSKSIDSRKIGCIDMNNVIGMIYVK